MSNRKIDVVILKLTNQEYDVIEKIIDNSNKSLERSREKSREKREEKIANGDTKVRKEVSYKRPLLYLDDYISGQEKIRVIDLKKERNTWKNPPISEEESNDDPEKEEVQVFE